MKYIELIKLFEKYSEIHQLGEFSYLKIYDDGSGGVFLEDNDVIFRFDDEQDLIEKLRQ
jgi:hypothetical protein